MTVLKQKFFVILLIILIVLTIAYIFHNSITGSEESNAQSESVADVVQPIVDPSDHISDRTFNKVIRKAAHVFEYGVLGCELMGLALILSNIKKRQAINLIIVPLFVILLTAVIDEFIQSYTGRTSQVKDVLIDFAGGIAGLLIVNIINIVVKQIKKKRIIRT